MPFVFQVECWGDKAGGRGEVGRLGTGKLKREEMTFGDKGKRMKRGTGQKEKGEMRG